MKRKKNGHKILRKSSSSSIHRDGHKLGKSHKLGAGRKIVPHKVSHKKVSPLLKQKIIDARNGIIDPVHNSINTPVADVKTAAHAHAHIDHAPAHHNASAHHTDPLKEGVITGFEETVKTEHVVEKEFSVTDKKNYKFTVDEILRRLFVVEDKKKKKMTMKEKTYLKVILSQAGYDIDADLFKKRVFRYTMIAVALWTVLLLVYGFVLGAISGAIVAILASWIVFFPFLLLLTWGIIFYTLDYKKYMRKKELEEVWPEYLQIVVSNINAGMLIDVALWSAVKPKYKVLAKEIEQVAKETLTGKELSEALTEFAEKYDSPTVQRTISLLIEGMESGGKIAVLLNKISLDIQDTKIMKKEMSASVMTYSIFITFATVVAAPFLFGLSTQLLIIIQGMMGKLGQTTTNSMITFSSDTIKLSDFKTFAYIMLGITSFMSACLIGSIRKGSIKDGLKYIPLFMVGTIVIYYISTAVLAVLFSGLL
jgi:Flp pilus assembly protein TadB